MFCEKCGSYINEGAAFCSKCGNPVASAGQSTGNAPISGMMPGSQSPSGNWLPAQAGQGNGGKPKSSIPWKPIVAIGGAIVALIAVIVLMVVLVNNLDGGSSSSRRNRDTEEEESSRRSSRDKKDASDNEELLQGEWVSHRDTTIGSEFAVLYLDASIKGYKKSDPDWAEALEYWYGDLSPRELMEEMELDETTEILLEFYEDGELRVNMYDEWFEDDGFYLSYRVRNKDIMEITCEVESDDITVTFTYEAEYEVDEDSLMLDFFGKTITFDRD